jgi:hypothetical protein
MRQVQEECENRAQEQDIGLPYSHKVRIWSNLQRNVLSTSFLVAVCPSMRRIVILYLSTTIMANNEIMAASENLTDALEFLQEIRDAVVNRIEGVEAYTAPAEVTDERQSRKGTFNHDESRWSQSRTCREEITNYLEDSIRGI